MAGEKININPIDRKGTSGTISLREKKRRRMGRHSRHQSRPNLSTSEQEKKMREMDPDLVGIGNETWVHGQEGKKKLKQKKKQISKSDRDGGRKNKRKREDEMEEGKRARMRIQDKSLSLRLNKAGEKVF